MLHIKCAGTQMLWESSTLRNIRQKMILKIYNSLSCLSWRYSISYRAELEL